MKKYVVAFLVYLVLIGSTPSYATVTTTNISNTGTGTGALTTFPFTFAAQQASDIQVFVNTILQTTGYVANINQSGVGGTIVFSSAPANSAAILIQRTVPLTQTTHLSPDSVLSEAILENAYDKAIMAIQQVAANASSSSVQSITPGLGIGITGTTTVPIITNTGVRTLTSGANVTITGTPTDPIISSTGGGGGGGSSFTSTDQTITTSGTLAPIAHGLGAVPGNVVCFLVNQSTEAGFSPGDLVYGITAPSGSTLGTLGADATNINVTYGNGAGVFSVFHKTTGAATTITNAKWKMRIVASTGIGGGGGGTGSVTGISTASTPAWLVSTWANPSTTPAQTIASATGLTQNQVLATPDGTSGQLDTRNLVNNDLPTVSIAKGGTNNPSLSVVAGTVYYADGTKIVGLAPGTGLLQLNGASAPTIVSSSNALQSVHVTVSSAQIIALNGAPVTLVAAQGAGTTIKVLSVLYRFNAGGTQFNGNLNPTVGYTGGANTTSSVSSAVINSASSSETIRVCNDVTALQNTAVVLRAASGAATTGNGSLDMYVDYTVK